MGTVVEVTVAHQSEETARTAMGAAFDEIERIDLLLSGHRSQSLVSKINNEGALRPVPVGPELYPLFVAARGYGRESDGAFDVTVGVVSRIWKFEPGGVVPDPAEAARALAKVGYDGLLLDDSAQSVGFARDGMAIDLGAIAKGWAVDRAIDRLKSLGIESAIIDAGGDLRLIGTRPGKRSWRIGIQHPREQGSLIASLDLADTAVVTSGDYERFFVADGVRYHHILDPATGRPASGCRSVTVIAPTAMEADACATAAFVLGPQRGIAFLRARPGVRGMIVDAAGALHWTDAALEREAHR